MADLSERKRDAFDRIELRTYSVRATESARAGIIALAVLVAVLLAGAAVPILTGLGSPRGDGSTVLIALATLCLGFGSASVLYQYYRSRETVALRAQQDSLRERANTLLHAFRDFEERSRSMSRDR